jgi:hypothetical protein
LFHASQASGRFPCVLPLPALPLPGLSAVDSVARLGPHAREDCRAARDRQAATGCGG